MDWVSEFYAKQNAWCGVATGDPTEADHVAAQRLERWLGPGRKRILELGAGGGQRAVYTPG